MSAASSPYFSGFGDGAGSIILLTLQNYTHAVPLTLCWQSVNSPVVPFVTCGNHGCSVPATISVAHPSPSSLPDHHVMENIVEPVSYEYLEKL